MRRYVTSRGLRLILTGAVILQATGCDFTGVLEIAQTVLLGITAAGSVAILQNV